MKASSKSFIWKLFLSHNFILRAHLDAILCVRRYLRFGVYLLLNVEMHDIFALCTYRQFNLSFALLVCSHTNDFCEFNFHAGPTAEPKKVFLFGLVPKEMHPSLFCSGTEIVIAVCGNTRVHGRHLIWIIIGCCDWRRLHLEIYEEIKHLENQEIASLGASHQIVQLGELVVGEVQSRHWFRESLILHLLRYHLILKYTVLFKHPISWDSQYVSVHGMKSDLLQIDLIEVLLAEEFARFHTAARSHRPLVNHYFGRGRVQSGNQVLSIVREVNWVYLSLVSRLLNLSFEKIYNHL